MSEWISVKDRLPKKYVEVLVCVEVYLDSDDGQGFEKKRFVNTDCLIKKTNNGMTWAITGGTEGFTVTHWMPLPEPPEGE